MFLFHAVPDHVNTGTVTSLFAGITRNILLHCSLIGKFRKTGGEYTEKGILSDVMTQHGSISDGGEGCQMRCIGLYHLVITTQRSDWRLKQTGSRSVTDEFF